MRELTDAMTPTLLIADFTAASPDLGWHVVNDDVMGGRSSGGFELVDGRLIFSGSTNTNGGGFSSIRTAPAHFDLSAYSGIGLSVVGDGRRYTWRLTTKQQWNNQPVAYRADFETSKGEAVDVHIPFSAFVAKFRGQRIDAPEIDASAITSLGVMIYDKLDGDFELQLLSIRGTSCAAV